MATIWFQNEKGTQIPAITAHQMRQVDDLAVGPFGLGILQMMENAGRNLALNAMQMMADSQKSILILAGPGGNGGGGICAARHLHNHGRLVELILSRPAAELSAAAQAQYHILLQAGLQTSPLDQAPKIIAHAELIIDALIGYSLRGAPHGVEANLIALAMQTHVPILSLDMPSGRNSTDGAQSGVAIIPTRTLTLALPKTGLVGIQGEVYLADIGIPNQLYVQMGIPIPAIFDDQYWAHIYPVSS